MRRAENAELNRIISADAFDSFHHCRGEENFKEVFRNKRPSAGRASLHVQVFRVFPAGTEVQMLWPTV
jgi:hypothetical protein